MKHILVFATFHSFFFLERHNI